MSRHPLHMCRSSTNLGSGFLVPWRSTLGQRSVSHVRHLQVLRLVFGLYSVAPCGLACLVSVGARVAPAASAVQISHLALASCARLARHLLGVVPAPRQWAEGARVWELCASVGLPPYVGGGVLPRRSSQFWRAVLLGRSCAWTSRLPRLVCHLLGVVPALRQWAEGARSVTCVPLLPGRPVWAGAARRCLGALGCLPV